MYFAQMLQINTTLQALDLGDTDLVRSFIMIVCTSHLPFLQLENKNYNSALHFDWVMLNDVKNIFLKCVLQTFKCLIKPLFNAS